MSDIQHTDASPPSKILAAVGARQLLEQVNRHVLEGTGELAQGKGAIRLVWSDPESGTARSIMIRIQDSQTLLINGRPFPATREGIQQGLVTLLKGMGLSGNRDRVSEDS
ncbi:MAG: hypothetical protein GTO18_06245 [Anaerolineales bacterium]|nr:hypothetical protein [Anaerolineales bacterium]